MSIAIQRYSSSRRHTSSSRSCLAKKSSVIYDERGVHRHAVSGFLRIVTHPRITSAPAPISAAIEFTRSLVDAPKVQWLTAGATSWAQLEALTAQDSGIRDNLVPDAYIAALCLANGARLATRDRGFARFPGLQSFNPGHVG